jgi:hypothetical protein
MLEYRVCFVGSDYETTDVLAFTAADDDDAVRHATPLVDGHDVEVWAGDRLVAYIGAATGVRRLPPKSE